MQNYIIQLGKRNSQRDISKCYFCFKKVNLLILFSSLKAKFNSLIKHSNLLYTFRKRLQKSSKVIVKKNSIWIFSLNVLNEYCKCVMLLVEVCMMSIIVGKKLVDSIDGETISLSLYRCQVQIKIILFSSKIHSHSVVNSLFFKAKQSQHHLNSLQYVQQ